VIAEAVGAKLGIGRQRRRAKGPSGIRCNTKRAGRVPRSNRVAVPTWLNLKEKPELSAPARNGCPKNDMLTAAQSGGSEQTDVDLVFNLYGGMGMLELVYGIIK
jgi:hypothetical protein